jgi:membrane associated rhomboid family serine protease/Zn-finger nucleic acid-binding protein
MHCPACGAPFVPAQYEGLMLERCMACSATWFTAGLIKACADAMVKAGGLPDAPPDFGYLPVEAQKSAYQCPHCARPMEKLNYGGRSNILVDHCTSCGGVWADDAKVRDIAVFTKANPAVEAIVVAAPAAEAVKIPEALAKAGVDYAPDKDSWKLLLPIGTNAPASGSPAVSTSIIVLSMIAYFARFVPHAGTLLRRLALVPALIAAGHNYHGFLTSIFLHAGILSLCVDMYFLWVFGKYVESAVDHGNFLLLYLVAGVIAGALQALLNSASAFALVGAAGAVSGVLGAFLRLYPKAGVTIRPGPGKPRSYPARFYVGAWFALQAVSLLWNSSLGASVGVGLAALLAGFAAGGLLTPVPDSDSTLLPA